MTTNIINFYKFLPLTPTEQADLQKSHSHAAESFALVGTILIAHEGINVGLAGNREDLSRYIDFLKTDPRLADVEIKYSEAEAKPYKWLEVKIKPAIVTFAGAGDPDVTAIVNAPRLSPEEWLRKINSNDPDLVLVDTRNDYEYDWGTFKGAENLGIRKFGDFPAAFLEKFVGQEEKTFLFFCTGGIRCEKAVPWAQKNGFTKTYQLDGGIIGYLDKFGSRDEHKATHKDDHQYNGSCFVFDHRWAVDTTLKETDGSTASTSYIQPKPAAFRKNTASRPESQKP